MPSEATRTEIRVRSANHADPTWLYLKSVGKVPLLTREQELELARSIDAIQNEICRIISRSPAVLQALIDLGKEIEASDNDVEETIRIPASAATDAASQRAYIGQVLQSLNHLQKLGEDYAKAVRQSTLDVLRDKDPKAGHSLEGRIAALKEEMVDTALSFRLTNEQIDRLVRLYRHAAEEGGADPDPLRNLARLELLRNRTKERLVNANVRLVVSIAKRYKTSGMELIDLIQEGNTALLRAVDNYDHTKGYKFSTYATWWIKQGITRAIADKAKVIRIPSNMLDLVRKVMKTYWRLLQQSGSEPEPSLIAAESGVSEEKVKLALSGYQDPISLDNYIDEGEKSSFGELIQDTTTAAPDARLRREALRKSLDAILSSLATKERDVLRMRFGLEDGQPKTLKETGEQHDISRERVRQIEAKAIAKLKKSNRKAALEEWLSDLGELRED